MVSAFGVLFLAGGPVIVRVSFPNSSRACLLRLCWQCCSSGSWPCGQQPTALLLGPVLVMFQSDPKCLPVAAWRRSHKIQAFGQADFREGPLISNPVFVFGQLGCCRQSCCGGRCRVAVGRRCGVQVLDLMHCDPLPQCPLDLSIKEDVQCY